MIKELINSQFIYQPFCHHVLKNTVPNWREFFKRAYKCVERVFRKQNSLAIISILMERLNDLKVHLIHGGTTWNIEKNRDQIMENTSFLKDFVPCLKEIMLNNCGKNWGDNNHPILWANKDLQGQWFSMYEKEKI